MRVVRLVLAWGLVFVMAHEARAAAPTIHINEVQIGGIDSHDEFIEFFNPESQSLDLTGWTLRKKTAIGAIQWQQSLSGIISPQGYFLWTSTLSPLAELADLTKPPLSTSSSLLASDNSLELLDPAGVVHDSASWKTISNGKSITRDASWKSGAPSPLNSAYIPEEPIGESSALPESDQDQPATVRISELFPNPAEKGEANEFIELVNFGEETIDLSGFQVRDASESGAYTLPPGSLLEAGSYLVITRAVSALSLNNTSETVTVLDAAEESVHSIQYEKTREEASYSYDGVEYRWTKHLTPGSANHFDAAPKKSKTKIPKTAYKDMPAVFVAGRLNGEEAQGYLWDFGDGTTSRKGEVLHTYEKTGTFHGTLTLDNGLEEIEKQFKVEVKKFKPPKVSLIALSPNPAGPDSGNEWLLIKNEDKKKIDLSDWSIATGTSKDKLTNHPFKEDFVLNAGEERIITSEHAAISLPNKKGYLELRLPNKERAQKIKYEMASGGAEDEVYRRISADQWAWFQATPENTEPALAEEADGNSGDSSDSTESEGTVLGAHIETITLASLTPEDRKILESEIREQLREEILEELAADTKNTDAQPPANPEIKTQEGSGLFWQNINKTLNEIFFNLSGAVSLRATETTPPEIPTLFGIQRQTGMVFWKYEIPPSHYQPTREPSTSFPRSRGSYSRAL